MSTVVDSEKFLFYDDVNNSTDYSREINILREYKYWLLIYYKKAIKERYSAIKRKRCKAK